MNQKNLGVDYLTDAGQLMNAGQYQRAKQIVESHLTSHGTNIQDHMLLGTIEMMLQKSEQAKRHFQSAYALNPNDPKVLVNLAVTYKAQNDHQQAICLLERALQIEPNLIPAKTNLCQSYLATSLYTKAKSLATTITRSDPRHAKAWHMLGLAATECGETSLALQAHQQAVHIEGKNAEYHWSLALAYLYEQQYEFGFTEAEWRWRRNGIQPSAQIFNKPFWDGNPFENKILLLHAEQGIGDTIQFARLASEAKARGGTVYLLCQPSICELMQTMPGIDHIVEPNKPLPHFDYHTPIMSLPRILHLRPEAIPATFPLLRVPISDKWAETISSYPGYKIAINWAGNPEQARDDKRSCTAETFLPLAELDNVSIFSIQKGPGEKSYQALDKPQPFINLSPQIDTFQDTAQIMQLCDLVITVDTSVAHLSGSLNVNTWTLLSFMPCWRWQLERDTSPWYPNMRLFRQPSPGAWTEVINDVKDALLKEINAL